MTTKRTRKRTLHTFSLRVFPEADVADDIDVHLAGDKEEVKYVLILWEEEEEEDELGDGHLAGDIPPLEVVLVNFRLDEDRDFCPIVALLRPQQEPYVGELGVLGEEGEG